MVRQSHQTPTKHSLNSIWSFTIFYTIYTRPNMVNTKTNHAATRRSVWIALNAINRINADKYVRMSFLFQRKPFISNHAFDRSWARAKDTNYSTEMKITRLEPLKTNRWFRFQFGWNCYDMQRIERRKRVDIELNCSLDQNQLHQCWPHTVW